ncbi:hypothetical protein MWN33_08950 [Starkeya koreensis]|uniref:Uncharacterized protein n=1 Tax=Ancylobacter koreensis TaxID=266121 RepID=A0ABT0DLI6_9HYPH|nr:hypothetical protein [Ancylobacter koreensis]MCK0208156.1 hypothetical protein [Ancylobacter koreensis]
MSPLLSHPCIVMAGRHPAIHAAPPGARPEGMDHRVKPGDDAAHSGDARFNKASDGGIQ